MWAVTGGAYLIVRNLRKLPFDFKAPDGSNPWILSTIHETDRDSLFLAPKTQLIQDVKIKLQALNSSQI